MADTDRNSGSNSGSTQAPKPEQQQPKTQPPAAKPHRVLFEDLRKGANTFPLRDNE
jgi:hypothetical protein